MARRKHGQRYERTFADEARLLLDGESARAVTLRLLVRRWNSNGNPVPACATGSAVTLAGPLGRPRRR